MQITSLCLLCNIQTVIDHICTTRTYQNNTSKNTVRTELMLLYQQQQQKILQAFDYYQ